MADQPPSITPLPPATSSPGAVDASVSHPAKSYSSAVQNKSNLTKHHLDISVVNGNQVVQVPDEIFEDSAPLWEDFLIGKFLSTTAPHVAKIHVIVNKIWPLGDKSVRIDVFEVNDTTVKFRIKESQIRDRVLRRGMWNIADVPMVVSKWSPIIEEAQPDIKTIPMWIVIKNVPQKMFTWKGLGFISSAVGDPKRLHPDTILCKSFEEAKVFVEADLSKELPKSFRFQSDKGVDAEVDFKYPWLPPKCVSCEKWGHLKDVCLMNKEKLVLNTTTQDVEVVGTEVVITTAPVKQTLKTQEVEIETTEAEAVTSNPTQEERSETIPSEQSSLPNHSNQIEPEEEWCSVSPSKIGRHSQRARHVEEEIIVSPSPFAVLEEAGGDNVQEQMNVDEIVEKGSHLEIEEGEIQQKLKGLSGEKSRLTLPRASKASHKFISKSRSQLTKDMFPSTSSKKGQKKKT